MFSTSLRSIFLLATAVLAVGCGESPIDDLADFEPYDPRVRLQQIFEIEVDNVVSLIKTNPKVMIIDVRDDKLFHKSRLPGASHYYYESGAFEAEIGAIDRDTPLLVYGTVGTTDPAFAANDMRNLGFLNVYFLTSGLEGWIEAGQAHETGF